MNAGVNKNLVNNTSDVEKLSQKLIEVIRPIKSAVVAFSGGVDSTVLAFATLKALGVENVEAVTAVSPSLAEGELENCRSLSQEMGLVWKKVFTEEMSNENYILNNSDRCYWCKDALMDSAIPIAEKSNAVVLLGVNLDDLDEHRPGQEAARERGAIFPLVEAGLDKDAVRELAKFWNLKNWDRPAQPCLASRVPYGTVIDLNLLSRVDRAEASLRAFGFKDLRVRHYGETARIELERSEILKAAEMSEHITDALTDIGYKYVTLDLKGLKSGNLNDSLKNE